jgi:glutathione S-transferase
MTIQTPLRLYGEHCSPYTRKMLSLLRYRGIAYQLLQGGPGHAPRELPKPKVGLLPTFYLTNEEGSVEAVVDSTPLIRRFEQEFEPCSVIPSDPALEFVDYLLEDYGDEWLTKAMFHYRWAHQPDADKAGTLLPLQHTLGLTLEEQEQAQRTFRERQVSRLHVVGSNEITGQVIEKSYQSFLHAFDHILQQRPFLFGRRPAAADFALYGQLTQLAGFDPTPMRVTLETAPRVCAWVNNMDDLSGQDVGESGWLERDQLLDSLKPLLKEIGCTYVPVMLANAEALACGDQIIHTTVDGKPWEQPAFPYHGRCLQWIREQYGALADGDRRWVDALLFLPRARQYAGRGTVNPKG